MLILASQSPRRAELLKAAGVRFRAVTPPEEAEGAAVQWVRSLGPPSQASRGYRRLVMRAALAKARAVARTRKGLVLGADTIVVCAGRALGKPSSRADARRMLQFLSGRRHAVYTGLALVCGEHYKVGCERTEVAFRRLPKAEIDRYIASGEPMDKAGAYAIQGKGAALVRAIRGCYSNVIGLPIPKVLEMLGHFAAAKHPRQRTLAGAGKVLEDPARFGEARED